MILERSNTQSMYSDIATPAPKHAYFTDTLLYVQFSNLDSMARKLVAPFPEMSTAAMGLALDKQFAVAPVSLTHTDISTSAEIGFYLLMRK